MDIIMNQVSDTNFYPAGFKSVSLNLGIKDKTKDFLCVYSTAPCTASGVFTQSRFAGPSVEISRSHINDGRAQAIVAISKNANVATGLQGKKDAEIIVNFVSSTLGIKPSDVLIASTGVIGKRYPMEKIISKLSNFDSLMVDGGFEDGAEAIMTTDTVPKISFCEIGNGKLVGIAKGVGMMEPNMATLFAFFFTDVKIEGSELDKIFKNVMDRTFNCLSIDTDTSTSDSAVILSNGSSGNADHKEFESALYKVSESLVKSIAKDGEGATKLIQVNVKGAESYIQAKKVAKSIVNSPLVKTAVHGEDPNWGRVAMAIGKCEDEASINSEKTSISFCGIEVYPRPVTEKELHDLEVRLKNDEISIDVDLGVGHNIATVWGCDLSSEYVRINGEYTT